MDKLDKVIDVFINTKGEIVNSNAPSEAKDELLAALREKTRNEIVQEIKATCKNEILKEANLEIQKKVNQEKLKQLRDLMWSGFFIAFIVGLTVNQITDIIGYFKGSVSMENITVTVILSIVLVLACWLLYGYSFMKEVFQTFKDIKNEMK